MRREEAAFQTAAGLRLFEQYWLPKGDPKSVVVIVHGYAEHSGRYVHVAERLTKSGYGVYAFDLRGHGRSEGARTFIRSFDEYLADLDNFLARVRERQPDVPLFLLGHSMGGTIVTLYVVSGEPDVRGVILSGPGLKLRGNVSRILQAVLLVLGRLVPKLPLGKLDSPAISRDRAVVKAYDNDPLVYRGRMRAGTAAALLQAVRRAQAQMEAVSLPLLLLHGTADSLTDPEGSRQLYERASSADKTLKLYQGLYHEVLNEPERGRVLADLIRWLDAHSQQRTGEQQ